MATKPQDIGGLSTAQASGIQQIYKNKLASGLTPEQAKASIKADPAFSQAKDAYNAPAQATPTFSGSVSPVGMQKTEGAAPIINNTPVPTAPVDNTGANTASQMNQTNLEVQRNKEQAAFNAANPVGTKTENIAYTAPEKIKPIASVSEPQAVAVPKTQEQAATGQKIGADGGIDMAAIKQNADDNRKREILMNLDEGYKNDPEINKAITTGDYETYKTRYEYDIADENKKRTLDAYFQAKQPKDSEGIYAILKTGARIASQNIINSPDYAKAKAKADIYNKLAGMTSSQLLTEMKNGNIGTEMDRELAGDAEYAAAKQQFAAYKTTSDINKTTQDALDVIKNKEKKEDTTLQNMSDKATANVAPEKLPSLQEYMKKQAPELTEKVASFNQKNQLLRELSDQRDNMLRTVIKDHPGISKGAAMVLASRNNESINDQIKSMSYDLQTMQADINYATEIVKADFENAQKQQESSQAFARQKELAQFQQDLSIAGNVKEFEQKLAQQAKFASDPYTAISTVMDEYKKMGVPFDQGISTKVADANAFIAAGGTIGQYVDNMIADIKEKKEYKAIQAEKFQQKPITVGKDSFIYDPVTKTFSSPTGAKLGNTATSSLLSTPEGIGSFTTQRKNPEGVMSTDVQCGMLVNDWYKSVTGQSAGIGDTYSDKLGTVKRIGLVDQPEVGSIFVSNPFKNNIGHTGIVQSVNPDGSIVVREANKQGFDMGGPAVTSTYSKKQADEMMFAKSPITSSPSGLKDLGEYLIDTQARGAGFSDADVKQFTDSVQKYVDRGDENTVNQLFRDRILARKGNEVLVQGSTGVLNNIATLSKDIQDYVAKSGDTGLFKGTIEQIQNKLGNTGDPALASIANRVGMLTADYIKEISGTAASDPEVQRLIALLPSTKTTVTLNDIYLKNFDQKVRNRVQSSMEVSIGNKYKALAPKLFPEIYTQPETVQTSTQNSGGRITTTGGRIK